MLIKKLIIKTRMITGGDHRHGLQIERSDSLPSELPDELKLAGNYWNLPIRSQSKSRPVKNLDMQIRICHVFSSSFWNCQSFQQTIR